MGVLDKYELTTKPPKKGRMGAKPTERIKKKFLAGVEKQKTQAKAWKPGAKDLRGGANEHIQRQIPGGLRHCREYTTGPRHPSTGYLAALAMMRMRNGWHHANSI